MDERLRRAAGEGNVIDLYGLIEEDGNVLKRIDKVEFINTPLHITAVARCIDFAMKKMSLNPSFARKLNQQGLSSMFANMGPHGRVVVVLTISSAQFRLLLSACVAIFLTLKAMIYALCIYWYCSLAW
ncbi:hypothetical protein PTKIN_Ptkin16aG0497300 [Pterospermum kingtungense]